MYCLLTNFTKPLFVAIYQFWYGDYLEYSPLAAMSVLGLFPKLNESSGPFDSNPVWSVLLHSAFQMQMFSLQHFVNLGWAG